MEFKFYMLFKEINNAALTAGFTNAEISAQEAELRTFTVLILQKQTEQLLSLFSEYLRAELQSCAHACEVISQGEAASILRNRAQHVEPDAEQILANHLGKKLKSDGGFNSCLI